MLNHRIRCIYFYTREYVIQLVLKAMKSPFIQPVEEDSEEKVSSVEPWYNKKPRDWKNMFLITRFHYAKVIFHIFYYYWGNKNHLFYRGLCYNIHCIEVCYIEVPLLLVKPPLAIKHFNLFHAWTAHKNQWQRNHSPSTSDPFANRNIAKNRRRTL